MKAGCAFLALAIILFVNKMIEMGTIVACIVVVAFGYSTASTYKPYVAFETRRNRSVDKWSSWVIMGTLTFLIFGTALVFLRKRLFGF